MANVKINLDAISQLPPTGFVRLRQILGDKKAKPPLPPIIPMSKTSWYKGVKSGEIPPGIMLGKRMRAWRVAEILAFIEKIGA